MKFKWGLNVVNARSQCAHPGTPTVDARRCIHRDDSRVRMREGHVAHGSRSCEVRMLEKPRGTTQFARREAVFSQEQSKFLLSRAI